MRFGILFLSSLFIPAVALADASYFEYEFTATLSKKGAFEAQVEYNSYDSQCDGSMVAASDPSLLESEGVEISWIPTFTAIATLRRTIKDKISKGRNRVYLAVRFDCPDGSMEMSDPVELKPKKAKKKKKSSSKSSKKKSKKKSGKSKLDADGWIEKLEESFE